MRRVLVVVNVLIAIAVIVAAGIFYWVFYRALPQTSGTIRTQVGQPVEVIRDGLGVAHIQAKTLDDALFVQGYTVAEDRMWQMDTLRRLAAGELSEIVGAGALNSDREARRFRMRRVAEQIYTQLTDTDRKRYAAYARGVNAYIESHHGRYGMEFRLLGYDPRPWSTIDSLLTGLQMFRTLTATWKPKLIKSEMLRNGEPEKIAYLFPVRSGMEILPGGDARPGSNAWAVSGAHSYNGKPLLSNDMHLDFSLPGIWHMVHLQTPAMNVAGMELPGFPGVISGHNDRIAWGLTNLGFDVQELYLERIDLRSGRYVFAGKLEQARQEREVINVKGGRAEELTIWVTRHGPIFQQTGNTAMALKWAAAELHIFENVFLDIDAAHNWNEFRTALSRFGGPGQNFVYADVDGNIGYQAAGKLPIRRNYYGDVPVDGSTGENEWDGYIPFDQLPESFNPPSGFIVSANQNPFPVDYPWHVGGSFAPQYRSTQIRDMLAAGNGKLRPEDNLRIEKDVYSGASKYLASQLAAAYEKRGASNPLFTEPVRLLKTWDGQMDQDRPEPFIVTLAAKNIRKAIAERASPGSGDLYDTQLSSAVVEKMLRDRPPGWFASYDDLLLRSLTDAMDEAQRLQGADPKRWKWGKYMFLDGAHPVGGRIPVIGSYFNVGPVPLSGGPTTVKQTTRVMVPSERMNFALGSWDDSLWDLPVGQSGNVASSHYKDEWEAYSSGRSFPMQFRKIEAKSTVTFEPAP